MAISRSRRSFSKKRNGKKNGKKKSTIPSRKPAQLTNAIPAICSECYGDFSISTNPSKNNITCPTCGHVGIVEEGCFEDINQKQSEHKKNFIIAILVNVIAFICILVWGFFNSWPIATSLNMLGVVVSRTIRSGLNFLAMLSTCFFVFPSAAASSSFTVCPFFSSRPVAYANQMG